jgi:pimeloyl-ACP methyl ester carboxylesterase
MTRSTPRALAQAASDVADAGSRLRGLENPRLALDVAVGHRHVHTNGIDMHIAEAGSGPLVLLLHGFPELWYSWRHQLPALAGAGYHAIAPDLRGYSGLWGDRRTFGSVEATEAAVSKLRKIVLLPRCGHWAQQERPHEVNAELLDFLRREIAH